MKSARWRARPRAGCLAVCGSIQSGCVDRNRCVRSTAGGVLCSADRAALGTRRIRGTGVRHGRRRRRDLAGRHTASEERDMIWRDKAGVIAYVAQPVDTQKLAMVAP